MGKAILTDQPCLNTECSSSDAMAIYLTEDGKKNAHCFSCNKDFWDLEIPVGTKSHYNGKTKNPDQTKFTGEVFEKLTMDDCSKHPIRELKARGLSFSVAEKYGVRVGLNTADGITPTYYLFPEYKDGELCGYKKKDVATKSYKCIGDCKDLDLFGMHAIPKKANKLFITEGEEDALALYQALTESTSFDWDPAVVSLPNGATAAPKAVANSLDQLKDYDQIILVFDQDSPGKQAAKEVCKLLAGKVYTVSLPYKDANEMLLAGKSEDLKWTVLRGARKYQPDGIVNAKDCWDRYKNAKDIEYYPFPESMSGLNDKLYGIKPGTITTITAGTGVGKTQFMRELKYHYLTTTTMKIADISLEEDLAQDTLPSLVGLHLNKRITLPDVEVNPDEELSAFNTLFSSGRYTLYDYFGGMDDDNLFSKLRYLAANGNNLIFLDHLSIIVSEYASQGGERERIDTIMTKLAKLVKETGIAIVLVVHLKKTSEGQSFEEGAIPSLDDLRGSSSLKQLSWDIIALSRNQQHPDEKCANITELTSLKCRLTGRTGKAGYLYFDQSTGRMVKTTCPPNYYLKDEKKK